MSGEIDVDCGEGGGASRLTPRRAGDASRLWSAAGDGTVSAVGTVFVWVTPVKAGHDPPQDGGTGRHIRRGTFRHR